MYEEIEKPILLSSGAQGVTMVEEEKFVEAKTIAEAEAYARDRLGVPQASYKGCDVTTANAWNKGLADSFNRFPSLKQNFGFVGECHERNRLIKIDVEKYFRAELQRLNPSRTLEELEPFIAKQTMKSMKKYAVSKVTLAESLSKTKEGLARNCSGICVNRDFGKNSCSFVATTERTVATKFHPVGCDTIRSVLDHEIGHQLDNLLELGKHPTIQGLFDCRTNQELTDDISRYSWDNKNPNRYSEMIAEAWAEYCNNPQPRSIAKTIGELTEQLYKEKFG